MLTVDFTRFPVSAGCRVLDLGCGAGRHSFEVFRRGGDVVAFDRSAPQLSDVREMLGAMAVEGEAPAGTHSSAVRGDALTLPFPDESFDRVIAAEVLEHVPRDSAAMEELFRVLRPGGLIAVTVPSWLPERICWALSDAYHNVEGGHVRIYRTKELRERLSAAGLQYLGRHRAHALHSPYWWWRCVVGVNDDQQRVTKLYHRLLVWDMVKAPWQTRVPERLLNPLLGKSSVLYLRKPEHMRG